VLVDSRNQHHEDPGLGLGLSTVLRGHGMGREEGGGFRMGNTCIPVADSF